MKRTKAGAIDIDNYDPAVHDLPKNRKTRLALKSQAKRHARQKARHEMRVQLKIARVLEPFKGQAYTPELRTAMIDALCEALAITDRGLVDKLLKVEIKQPEGAS